MNDETKQKIINICFILAGVIMGMLVVKMIWGEEIAVKRVPISKRIETRIKNEVEMNFSLSEEQKKEKKQEIIDEEAQVEKELEKKEGENTSPSDLIKDAYAAADRMESENKKLSQLLDRQEALKVEETLGGKSSAGTPSQTKEQKETANARKMLEGTGFEDMLDEPK